MDSGEKSGWCWKKTIYQEYTSVIETKGKIKTFYFYLFCIILF